MSKKNGFNLSNVDLLACGLGACLLLMLSFIVNISGENSTKSSTSGKNNYISTAALILPDDIRDGKMVFIRMVEINLKNGQDYEELVNNLNNGSWNIDKGIIDKVEEQVFTNKKDLSITYVLLSDTLLQSKLMFLIQTNSLSSTFGRRGSSYSVNAKILEGGAIRNEEEIFSGYYNKNFDIENLRNFRINFSRAEIKGLKSFDRLIYLSEE